MKNRELVYLFTRYLVILLAALLLFYSGIFYSIFLGLTIYPVSWLLALFFNARVIFDSILVNNLIISIIPACVAVSAYFLLFMLNFLTSMKPIQRASSLVFSFALLLMFNILRILILSVLYVNGNAYLEIIHKTLWYSLNILVVIGIWFLSVYLFDIKNIPVYSDFKSIRKTMRTTH